jgi:hypothetical protein
MTAPQASARSSLETVSHSDKLTMQVPFIHLASSLMDNGRSGAHKLLLGVRRLVYDYPIGIMLNR